MEGCFSYWSQVAKNRPSNRGLRLDYAVASHSLCPPLPLLIRLQVRTYADFQANVQGWRLAPTVRLQLMMGGGGPGAATVGHASPCTSPHAPTHPLHPPAPPCAPPPSKVDAPQSLVDDDWLDPSESRDSDAGASTISTLLSPPPAQWPLDRQQARPPLDLRSMSTASQLDPASFSPRPQAPKLKRWLAGGGHGGGRLLRSLGGQAPRGFALILL